MFSMTWRKGNRREYKSAKSFYVLHKNINYKSLSEKLMLKAHAREQRGNCWSEGGNCAFKRSRNYSEKAVAEEERQEWGVNGKFLSKCRAREFPFCSEVFFRFRSALSV
jgi:hypothetical protein